ncbi:pentatricopeptide repeat-containing protein At3g58590-like [Aristolochia californica]|uniref:pentatricopeptide repeat-containing protein At3g58590-like n=1 Tax=Aristolochia californica TaxID=171875 RepID=UPI0035DAE624
MNPAFRASPPVALHAPFTNHFCRYSSVKVRVERIEPDRLSLLLQSCAESPSLRAAKSLHALVVTTLFDRSHQSVFFLNNLISIYAVCGELSIGRKLFDRIPEPNHVSFNSIISAYSRHGQTLEVSKLFSEMIAAGFRPTSFTFGSILRCSPLDWGFQLQSLILKSGILFLDAFTGTSLLGVFVKHECLHAATKLFDDMPQRNVITWNSLISVFSNNESIKDAMVLFRELLRTEIQPTEYSFVAVLSGFRFAEVLYLGVQIHGLVVKMGTGFYTLVANCLMEMYTGCSSANAAEKLFSEMPIRDAVSWNTIIGAFAKSDKPKKALDFFVEMSSFEIIPTQATFACVLGACVCLQVVNYGKFIHGKSIKNNFSSDVLVSSILVHFYVKCNKLDDAQCLFDEVTQKSIASWNTLISGYSKGDYRKAIYLLKEMLSSGYQPNVYTFCTILKSLPMLELQQLHSLITKMGYEQDKFVSSSFISSCADNGLIADALSFASALTPPLSVVQCNVIAGIYTRNAQYQEALDLLSQLKEPDIVSCNGFIEACARSGLYREAFELFKQMRTNSFLPDNCTFVSLLSISIKLCNLELGCNIHSFIIKMDFSCSDVFVQNVLVDMYAKCGNLEGSMKVFDEMSERNVISWTSLISGLALHGCPQEALRRFKEMETYGITPDKVTFISVLSACRHGGLVEEGMRLFGNMKKLYGIEPEMDHYACVVDMLCRNGHLKEAEKVICIMPSQPGSLVWRSFLEGCKRYNTE